MADDQTKENLLTTRVINRSTLRRYLLITLNHVERGNRSLLTTDEVIARLTRLFRCKSIIICKENHAGGGGFHMHIGVWNETASKNTVRNVIRGAFPEFEGRQCNVSIHKVWDTVCTYVLKEDNNPVIWGEETLEEVKERASYKRRNDVNEAAPKTEKIKKNNRASNVEVLRRLFEKGTWNEVLEDEVLGPRCVTNYPNIYRLFIDSKLLKLEISLKGIYYPIKSLLFIFFRAYYCNQSHTYIVYLVLIALISFLISFLNEFDILHVFKGFDGNFFIQLFFNEFDFVAYTWDFLTEPVLALNEDERPSVASGINRKVFLTVLAAAAALVYLFYSNN